MSALDEIAVHDRPAARRRALRLAGHPTTEYPGSRVVHAASVADDYAVLLQLPDRTLRFCCGHPDFRYVGTMFCEVGAKYKALFAPVVTERCVLVAKELPRPVYLAEVFPRPGDRISVFDGPRDHRVAVVTTVPMGVPGILARYEGEDREVELTSVQIHRLLRPA